MSKVYTLDQDREWYNSLPTKRSSSAMIVRDGNKVLMVKDDYKDFWTFPGGVVDAGESPFVAALRETYEEVGIEIARNDAAFYSISYVPEKHGFMDRFHFFFISTAVHEHTATIMPEKGIEDYGWIAIDQIARLSGDRPGYIKLQAMLLTGHREEYFEALTTKD